MSGPPRVRSELWRRLAADQDAAVVRGDGAVWSAGGPEDAPRTPAAARGADRRRVWWRVPLGLVGGAIVAASIAGVVWSPRRMSSREIDGAMGGRPRALSPGARGVAERAFEADARSDLPLQFTDGSTIIFRAGSAGRMQGLTDSGAEIVLDHGGLEAHVVHADTTLWLVHAGPYRVRVTGTRFAMTWAAPDLQVDLFEGAVVIDGAVLGAGVPLRAGHRLKISAGVVLIEPLLAGAAGAAGVGTSAVVEAPGAPIGGAAPDDEPEPGIDTRVAPAPQGRPAASLEGRRAGSRPGDDDEWMALAERGAYRPALSAAERRGWGTLCHHLDARHLLTLGDVARYSGARQQARQAFQALVGRFPGDRLAADAVFSLGRLAFESNHPEEAARWFRRYVADWPNAPLADQAAGRLLECAVRVDDGDAARIAARRYLARAPAGPHAALAREVLHDQPADSPP